MSQNSNNITLSLYVPTYNSEKYLAQVLDSAKDLADEVVVVDSGSSDGTKKIAQSYKAKWVTRAFDNFQNQRNFAIDQCTGDWILNLDDDEVLNPELAQYLQQVKQNNFVRPEAQDKTIEAYRVHRTWFVCGQKVSAFYPVRSPDHPIKLFKKSKNCYYDGSIVHIEQTGLKYESIIEGPGTILHYSCDDLKDLLVKRLSTHAVGSSYDILMKRPEITVTGCYISSVISAISAWIKWYWLKDGYKDGKVGWVLGKYSYLYTRRKYLLLAKRLKAQSTKQQENINAS